MNFKTMPRGSRVQDAQITSIKGEDEFAKIVANLLKDEHESKEPVSIGDPN